MTPSWPSKFTDGSPLVSAKRPLHILFVCHEYPPHPHGGIGVFVKTTAEALVQLGWRASVIGASLYPGKIRTEERQGVRIHNLSQCHIRKIGPLYNRLTMYWTIERMIRDEGVDIVEYPDFQGHLFRHHSVPTVLRLHGSMTYFARFGMPLPRFLKWAERRSVRVADAVIGVSKYALQQAIVVFGYTPQRTRVVYYGVDLECFVPVSDAEDDLILYYGTLTPRKGVLRLARAANQFLRELPDARLAFVGPDSFEGGHSCAAAIREAISEDLAGRVDIAPAVPHEALNKVIQRAKLCVFPSHMETLDTVLLEAMSAGKAIVAPTRGPMTEVFEDGKSGILVDPQDETALSSCISRVYRDAALRRELGAAARRSVEARFSLSRAVEANCGLYWELAADTIAKGR